MSFGTQSGAFLDELEKIMEEKIKFREGVYGKNNTQRPSNNGLISGEEYNQYRPYAIEPSDPEIITRL